MNYNGYIVQDVNWPWYAPTTFSYSGLCAYDEFPLIHINDPECREITDKISSIKDSEGYHIETYFIEEKSILQSYLNICNYHNIKTRVLYVNMLQNRNNIKQHIENALFLGYECITLPVDDQIVSDLDYYGDHFPSIIPQLNECGLFDSISDAKLFLNEYKKYCDTGELGDDIGDIYIFEVWQLVKL